MTHFTILLAFLLSPLLSTAQAVQEYQLKAVLLYNFAHFVAFPQRTQETLRPFTFCSFGQGRFEQALEVTLENQSIAGELPALINLHAHQSNLDCDIIFFPESEKDHYQAILSTLKTHPVLTASDIKNFSSNGGMIEFTRSDNKIKLIINNDNARAAGLTIKANLLNISTIVSN